MIDLTLTDEQIALRDAVRDFARREVAPAVEAADRDEQGHLSRDEYLRLFKGAAGVGLTSMLLPEAYGGGGSGQIDNAIVQEELGAVDAGFAASLNLTMSVPQLIVAAGSDEQKERWLRALATDDDLVLAGALNEPDVAGSELFCPAPPEPDRRRRRTDAGPERYIKTEAHRDGDEWVIAGAKAGWVTNAGVAKAYLVFARTDLSRSPLESTSAFWVPADAPGVSIGPRSSLLGLRSGWHAEVILDDVRVPGDALIGPDGGALPLLQMATPGMAIGLAAAFVGLARSAYEMSLAYAGERESCGVPIRQHQAVALKLADAAVDLQAARLVVLDAAAALDRGADPMELAVKVPAAKTYAVDVAIANAERAVQIFGGMGVTSGVGPEKLLRDAWTGYSCDFTRDMLRLAISSVLQ